MNYKKFLNLLEVEKEITRRMNRGVDERIIDPTFALSSYEGQATEDLRQRCKVKFCLVKIFDFALNVRINSNLKINVDV